MARRNVTRVLFQPALPFEDRPITPAAARNRRQCPDLSASRAAQLDRAAAKLRMLVQRNHYAAGIAEFHIDRLLLEEWPAGQASRANDLAAIALGLTALLDEYPPAARRVRPALDWILRASAEAA